MRRLAKCRPPHLLELGILRTKLRGEENKNGESYSTFSVSVPLSDIFTNQFLEDLDKIWELRHWIPDPTKPINPHEYHKRISQIHDTL